MFRRTIIAAILLFAGIATAQVATTQPTVQIKEITPAKPTAQPGDTLFVTYTGKLENGNVFDTNVGGRLFRFVLGTGEVIKGWDQGMVGMGVGEKLRLVIPPELGYGKTAHGQIPANSTLIFDVELVGLARLPK